MHPEAPDATGTLVFLHGTGDPNPVFAETVRSMLANEPTLAHFTVLNVAWTADAAPDVSVVPALPPRYQPSESATHQPTAPDRGLALAGLDMLAAPPLPLPGDPEAPAESDAAAAEENLLGSSLQRLTLNLVTDVAVRRRVPLTEAASDFSRSIIFYLRRGEEARTVIARALGTVDQKSPVILFGHSLGGVAALDLVSGPDWAGQGRRLDLLVTAGSQSPWLYLLGGLAYLAPNGQGTVPVPWLNFWDERDLLSFCTERVFAGRGARIVDREVKSGEPFPGSHAAYFANPDLYRSISAELDAALAVRGTLT